MSQRIMISAGEASGDKHGAKLIKSLQANTEKPFCFVGMGSQKLKDAGCKLLIDSADIAVVGIVEVLAHWGQIQTALKALKNEITNTPPDLLVLIDYPEFNLKLAKFAKDRGIKVLFYISPQVWAWRPKRIKKIGDAISMMAVVFPFEVPLYEKANIPVRYVGHPLLDVAKPSISKSDAYTKFKLDPIKKTVGIFPGSRKSEIQRILPILLSTAENINKAQANIQYILPVASTLDQSFISAYTEKAGLDITFINHHYYDAINICDSIMTASGTATLEIALIGTPMVIIYKVSGLTYAIMSRLIQIPNIGLANIVAGKKVVPELVQKKAIPEAIATEVLNQLNKQDYNDSIRNSLKKARENLSKTDASTSLDRLVIELLKTK